ncbi:hypothetical protein FBU59_001265 [Linderina macrospora]|uniref:Uncharacterized protein n=1 Tax=Linderina macrospora TaxID=4868 RepID=A0ACC1JEJ7_9FUNG|nr:hypothetical protein FBU59_001265 [Linderina macrospora]
MNGGLNQVVLSIAQSASEGFMLEDGDALASLFVFSDTVITQLGSAISNVQDFAPYQAAILDEPFARFTAAYLTYVRDYSHSDASQRSKGMYHVADMFIPVFSPPGRHWLVRVLRSIAASLYQVAQIEDRAEMGSSAAHVQAASRLQSMLMSVLSDRDQLPESKHMGALFVAGLLVRVSLKIGAMPPAHAAVSNVAKAGLDFAYFSLRDQMTYKYWIGRYYLVCYRFEAAHRELEYAFNACPAYHEHNKHAILRHLVVANMIRGRLPTHYLLTKYDVEPVYGFLIHHFRQGNVAAFQTILMDNMEFFRSQGTFLILYERTEILMYRNVLKKVRNILAEGTQQHRAIPYKHILTAFQMASRNPNMDVPEMESIVSSLISQKYVHGYLFHHQQLLNLGSKTQFPPIKDVILPGGFEG